MVRAEAPSEACQEPGTEAIVLGLGEALGGQGSLRAGESVVQAYRTGQYAGPCLIFVTHAFFNPKDLTKLFYL